MSRPPGGHGEPRTLLPLAYGCLLMSKLVFVIIWSDSRLIGFVTNSQFYPGSGADGDGLTP